MTQTKASRIQQYDNIREEYRLMKPEDLVEIHLNYTLTIGVPKADENGKLIFREVPHHLQDVTIKVPEAVTVSEEALLKWLREQYRNSDTDIGCFNYANIYLDDDFKFQYN